jgi:hypothetical protein
MIARWAGEPTPWARAGVAVQRAGGIRREEGLREGPDRQRLSPLTCLEVDPAQLRPEVSVPPATEAEENFRWAGGIRDCLGAGARSPAAGHIRGAVGGKLPSANTDGHMGRGGSRAGTRAAQPLQEAPLRRAARLQAHLERNIRMARDETRRRSLQPQEAHPIGQIALKPRPPGQHAQRMEA